MDIEFFLEEKAIKVCISAYKNDFPLQAAFSAAWPEPIQTLLAFPL